MERPKIYATREMHGGLDWRSIARLMKTKKEKLSPSRARGLFLCAMEKFAYHVLKKVNGRRPETREVIELAMDPKFQQSVGAILRMAYGEEK